MEVVFSKKISQSGKTLQIIIPKDTVEAYKLKKGIYAKITLNIEE